MYRVRFPIHPLGGNADNKSIKIKTMEVVTMYADGNNALSMEVIETVRVYSKADIKRIKAETIREYKRKRLEEIKLTIGLAIVSIGTVMGMFGLWIVFGYAL